MRHNPEQKQKLYLIELNNMLKLKKGTLLNLKFFGFYFLLIGMGMSLTGCPARSGRKAARAIYENKMNFNFKDPINVNFNGVSFLLQKKFKKDYNYVKSIFLNGSDCRSYSYEDLLFIYFGISEIK
jgi:hypothetical protein